MFDKKENSSASILLRMFSRVKRLGGLYIESLRFKTTEKITIILAAVAFYAVAMALGLVCLIFISLAAGRMLAMSIEPYLAYFVIAAFYLLLLVLAFFWRRRIFIDPIARFISRVLVEVPPEERERQAAARKQMLNSMVAKAENVHTPRADAGEDVSPADISAVTVTGSAADDSTTVTLNYEQDNSNPHEQ